MALTAGVITQVSVASTTSQMVTTAASGSTAPYTQQWYRSTTTGFTPGVGNILTGQTALTLDDSSLIPNTVYYYKVVYTDAVAATVTATQVAVTTSAPSMDINAFSQTPFLGMLDLKVGPTNVQAAQIDTTQATALYAGTLVKIVSNTNGIPTVVAISANTDNALGVIVYDIKSQSYTAGARIELAQAGSCIYMYATAAIARGVQVSPDVTSPGGVITAASTNAVIGWAEDAATAAGQLIRVNLTTPSFKTFS